MSLQDNVAAAFKELNERRAAMGERTISCRDEAFGRIAFHLHEIEVLCDAFDIDPYQWLVDDYDTVPSAGAKA